MIALLAFVGLGLAAPFIARDPNNVLVPNGDRLMASTGDQIVLSNPIEILDMPHVVVQSGTLSLVRHDGKATTAGSALLDLLRGDRASLAIDGATIVINAPAMKTNPNEAAEPAEALAPLLKALSTRLFHKLSLTRSKVVVRPPNGDAVTFTNLAADVLHKSGQELIATGHFDTNGEKLTFDTRLDLKKHSTDGKVAMPVRISVNGELMRASLQGEFKIDDHFRITSKQATVAVADMHRLARWMGIKLARKQTPKTFSAEGQFDWSGRTVGFHNASLSLDDNKATGALSLTMNTPRPLVEGTLAADVVNLSRVLFGPQDDASSDNTIIAVSDLSDIFDHLTGQENSLLQQIDADVRVSASRVIAGPLSVGSTAASISLRNGRMQADIAEFVIDNQSRGRGQINAEAQTSPTTYSFRGKLTNYEVRPLLQMILGDDFIAGRADVSIDVSSKGQTRDAFMRGLAGSVKMKGRETMRVGVGLAEFKDAPNTTPENKSSVAQGDDSAKAAAETPEKNEVVANWFKTFRSNTTDILDLDAELKIHNGVFTISDASAKIPSTSFKAEGTFMPSRKQLNVRLTTEEPAADPATEAATNTKAKDDKPRRIIKFSGNWHAPQISAVHHPGPSAASGTATSSN